MTKCVEHEGTHSTEPQRPLVLFLHRRRLSVFHLPSPSPIWSPPPVRKLGKRLVALPEPYSYHRAEEVPTLTSPLLWMVTMKHP